MSHGQSFPKSCRLRRPSEFDRVFAVRMSVSDDALIVYGLANDLGMPRLGIVVSRKVGGAVVRNRWKRLLREAFRQERTQLPAMDLVCLPRAGQTPQLTQLRHSLRTLAQRVEQRVNRRRRTN